MRTIMQSLDSLIKMLTAVDFQNHPSDQVGEILRESSIADEELASYGTFEPLRYTRNLVFRNDAFELLILKWSSGSRSPVHDHGSRQCYMAVQRGSLLVEDFFLMSGGRRQGDAHIGSLGTTTLQIGDIDIRTSTRDLHRVSAPAERAISLHVYAQPLDRFMVFDRATRSCRTVFSAYDSTNVNVAGFAVSNVR